MDKEFLAAQEKVTACFRALQDLLSDCEEMGFFDPEQTTYNRLLYLVNETNAVDTYPELKEVMDEGKEIEAKLEAWAAGFGVNSIETEWPNIPSS